MKINYWNQFTRYNYAILHNKKVDENDSLLILMQTICVVSVPLCQKTQSNRFCAFYTLDYQVYQSVRIMALRLSKNLNKSKM